MSRPKNKKKSKNPAQEALAADIGVEEAQPVVEETVAEEMAADEEQDGVDVAFASEEAADHLEAMSEEWTEEEFTNRVDPVTDFELEAIDVAPDGQPSPARTQTMLRFEEALTLEGQIEAVVFAAPRPLSAEEILDIVQIDDGAYTVRDVEVVLNNLVRLYQERNGGFRLEVLKGAYQFQSVPAAAPLMERLFASRPRPISRAALETLAIIAYRQPVTRADVEYIRGVDAGSIIKNLLERNLITCVGRKEDSGRPMLFGTTPYFLEVFRLNTLKDLPPLTAFQPAPETVSEAAQKLAGDDEVDVAGFIDDTDGRELTDEEREFIAADSAMGEETSENESEAEPHSAFSAAEEETSEIEVVETIEEDMEEEEDFEDEEVDEDLEAEEDQELDEPAVTEEPVMAEAEEPEPEASEEERSRDPFWELTAMSRKTSQSPEQVVQGASQHSDGEETSDHGNQDFTAAEVSGAKGNRVKKRGRKVDQRGEDLD